MNFYSFIKYLHSGFRYIVLILILVAIVRAFFGWLAKKSFTEGNRKVNLFALISAHTQLLIGLVLYFVSPLVQFGSQTMKDDVTRYWTVEHITGMIVAIVLITIGYSKSKKATTDTAKHKSIAVFYAIAVVVIIAVILQSHRPLVGM